MVIVCSFVQVACGLPLRRVPNFVLDLCVYSVCYEYFEHLVLLGILANVIPLKARFALYAEFLAAVERCCAVAAGNIQAFITCCSSK